MSPRAPRTAGWIVATASRLVPRDRRELWRRQWLAELDHRVSVGKGGWTSVRFAGGAIPHAVYLRVESMRMSGWGTDVKQSTRALLRSPGFASLTVLTLAMGIGTASAVFAIAEAMLLRPLPMEGGDRLVRIQSTNPVRGLDRFSVSYPDYADFAARTDLFVASTFYTTGAADLSSEGDPERVAVGSVHEEFFQTLRSPVVLGRPFMADDHGVAVSATAVLGEDFWVRRFGADSTIVGRSIRLDGVPHTVVGVVPEAQSWPRGMQVWTPLQWGGTVPEYADVRSNHSWQVVARLAEEVSVRSASAQISEMARGIYSRSDIDERDVGTDAVVVGLGASVVGGEGTTILALMGGAVFLVLLISCLNASGLLLTRAWGRAHELSLRAALGARRGRLVALVIGESLILAVVGGIVGVGLAVAGLKRLAASLPTGGPDLSAIELNPTVVGVALLISVAAAFMAGWIPGRRAAGGSVSAVLKEGGTRASQGPRRARLRRGLVVAELAMSLALLAGAGLTIRAFQQQITADPGFDQQDLLTFTVRLPDTRYAEPALVDAFYSDAVEILRRNPSVVGATTTSRLPLGAGGFGLYRSFVFDGAPVDTAEEYAASWVEIDGDYLTTMGISPLEGRGFGEADGEDAPLVAIVTRGFAEEMSPGESIIGKVIRSRYDENLPRTVVGVVGDIQFDGLSEGSGDPVVFVPRTQSPRAAMAFVVRTVGDPAGVVPEIRSAMTALDANLALDAVRTLREGHSEDLAGVRFLTVLFGAFGFLALALAVGGVYGLVAFSVSQRTREIGIRIAMGASRSAVRGEVLWQSARLAALGIMVGALLAYGFSRLLAAALFGVAQIQVGTFLAIGALLALSVMAASWIPARRATLVDPVDALRSD